MACSFWLMLVLGHAGKISASALSAQERDVEWVDALCVMSIGYREEQWVRRVVRVGETGCDPPECQYNYKPRATDRRFRRAAQCTQGCRS